MLLGRNRLPTKRSREDEIQPKVPPRKKQKLEPLEDKIQRDFNRGPNESDEDFSENLSKNWFDDLTPLIDRPDEFNLSPSNKQYVEWLSTQLRKKVGKLNKYARIGSTSNKAQAATELHHFAEQQWPTLKNMFANSKQ